MIYKLENRPIGARHNWTLAWHPSQEYFHCILKDIEIRKLTLLGSFKKGGKSRSKWIS